MTDKENFFDWLENNLAFFAKKNWNYEASWKELLEKDACGQSFELSANKTVYNRPLLYRLS